MNGLLYCEVFKFCGRYPLESGLSRGCLSNTAPLGDWSRCGWGRMQFLFIFNIYWSVECLWFVDHCLSHTLSRVISFSVCTFFRIIFVFRICSLEFTGLVFIGIHHSLICWTPVICRSSFNSHIVLHQALSLSLGFQGLVFIGFHHSSISRTLVILWLLFNSYFLSSILSIKSRLKLCRGATLSTFNKSFQQSQIFTQEFHPIFCIPTLSNHPNTNYQLKPSISHHLP